MAYVIYTSGLTGAPKGLMVEHRGAVNLGLALGRAFNSISFDAFIFEVVMGLLSGRQPLHSEARPTPEGDQLVRGDQAGRGDASACSAQHAGALNDEMSLEGLGCLIVGGETLPASLALRWSQGRRLFNAYRTGRLEFVASLIAAGDRPKGVPPRLTSIKIEGMVLLTLVRALKGLQALGVEPPFAVMVSLLGVKGVHINVGPKDSWSEDGDISVLTEDQYHFAEVILDIVPASTQDTGMMLRPFIEQLANTAGRAVSSSFGPEGEYLHVFR